MVVIGSEGVFCTNVHETFCQITHGVVDSCFYYMIIRMYSCFQFNIELENFPVIKSVWSFILTGTCKKNSLSVARGSIAKNTSYHKSFMGLTWILESNTSARAFKLYLTEEWVFVLSADTSTRLCFWLITKSQNLCLRGVVALELAVKWKTCLLISEVKDILNGLILGEWGWKI